MEEVLYEVQEEDRNEQGLPPGFRFHPTDEELITFYLASKVFNGSFCGVEVAELDLNRCEPWELPDIAKMGEREWYFFSLRDRKYPTGLRTNRATEAGYWKATGKDREVYSASTRALLGLKKTLVFYKGRAPRGEKTKWVMHEYRLDGDFSYRHTCKEEWVICRIYNKSGEKKTPFFQAHSCLQEASFPPLQETPTTILAESHARIPSSTLRNPNFIYPETNLKTLINPVVSQPQLFPTNINLNSIINPSPHTLYKPLSSHQGCTLNEPSLPKDKQCNTDQTNLSYFQPPDANLHRWVENLNQNPLLLQMDWGLISGVAEFQMMLDRSSFHQEA